MSLFDDQYLALAENILKHGERVENHSQNAPNLKNFPNHTAQNSGTVTYCLPHQILQFDLSKEFPILTTKQVAFKSAVLEILWIYQVASNDVRWLQDRNIKIWNEWQIDQNGFYRGKNFGKEFAHTIGTAYGWIVNHYDLTRGLIDTIKNDPNNRRMIISLWQNEWLPTAALPSCVWNTQWNVLSDRLNVIVTVRSNDVPLGMPFNVTQYATLCHLIAHVCGLKAGQMTYVINDAHIYENQIDGIKQQLARKNDALPAPTLKINPNITDFFKFDNSKDLLDIKLENYQHLGKISMPVTE